MPATLIVAICIELVVAAPDPPEPSSPCTEGGCHRQVSGAVTVHQPIREGKCIACHRGPGLAQPSPLFELAWKVFKREEPLPPDHSDQVGQPADASGPCRGCHQPLVRRMTEEKVHGPAGLQCLYCHAPHTSTTKYLLRARPQYLCTRCHEEAPGSRVHEPVVKGECARCHDPHASRNRMFLVDTGNGLCTGCHAEWHKARQRDAEPCMQCHLSHASDQKGLLRSAGERVPR